jgi:hypothetical protein
MAAHLNALEHLPRPAAGRLRAGSEVREVIRELADHAVAVGQVPWLVRLQAVIV